MDRVVIGMDPHKASVTIEARDEREVLRAGGRFGTDGRGYRQPLRFSVMISRSGTATTSAAETLLPARLTGPRLMVQPL